MVSGISSVSNALQANFLLTSSSASVDFSQILAQSETESAQSDAQDVKKSTLDGIAQTFENNWLEKFSVENEDEDENSKVSFDTSFDGMTGNIDEIISNQRSNEEQNIKQMATNQVIEPVDIRTWEDLVSDEILQVSIENNIDLNLKTQIVQKQAYSAYNLYN